MIKALFQSNTSLKQYPNNILRNLITHPIKYSAFRKKPLSALFKLSAASVMFYYIIKNDPIQATKATQNDTLWDLKQKIDSLVIEGHGESLQIANIYSDMSLLYLKQSMNSEAEDYSEKALDIISQLFGMNSIEYLNMIIKTREVWLWASEEDVYEEKFKKGLEICRKIGENADPYAGYFYRELGKHYSKQDRNDESIKSYEKAFTIFNGLGKEYAENTVACLYYIAETYDWLGQFQKAYEYASRAFEASIQGFGKEHKITNNIKMFMDQIGPRV